MLLEAGMDGYSKLPLLTMLKEEAASFVVIMEDEETKTEDGR